MRKSKKIVFRADGNRTIGLGHIYRLLALAKVCSDLEIVFVLKESSSASSIPKQYKVIYIPNSTESEPDWIQENLSPKEHLIVLDGYQFTSAYQKQLKGFGFRLVYIDDLAKEHMYADIVINHSPFFAQSDFAKEPYTKLALGTKYALLRPMFLKQAKIKKTIETIDTAFVCFGGADPNDFTCKVIKALLATVKIKKIHIVLGGAYKHKEVLNIQISNKDKVEIHRDLSEKELIIVMQQCNFGIVPASTILYELCCIKMPVLSGFYVDNQKMIYEGFLSNDAIFGADNFTRYKIEDFLSSIETIVDLNDFDNQLLAQKALFDHKIENRLLELIKSIC